MDGSAFGKCFLKGLQIENIASLRQYDLVQVVRVSRKASAISAPKDSPSMYIHMSCLL